MSEIDEEELLSSFLFAYSEYMRYFYLTYSNYTICQAYIVMYGAN